MAPIMAWAAATRETFRYAKFMNPTPVSRNSHTNNNLQIGLLKAFWNSYLFSVGITGPTHWSSLCYQLLSNIPKEPSIWKIKRFASFQWWAAITWQTDQVICTLHRLSKCCYSRAHRLKFEHTYCLLIGTMDEDVLILFGFFVQITAASYLQSIV